MASVGRLNYSVDAGKDHEVAYGTQIRAVLDKGINDGAVLSYRIPADMNKFTDLNNTMLEISFKITRPNLEPIDRPLPRPAKPPPPKKPKNDDAGATTSQTEDKDEFVFTPDPVYFDAGGIHSLFSSVELYLNDNLVSNMTSFPWTSALCRYIGTSKSIRQEVFDKIDGTGEAFQLKQASFVYEKEDGTAQTAVNRWLKTRPQEGLFTFKARVLCDFFCSVRQLLPPGVQIRLDLRRGADHVALATSQPTHAQVEGKMFRVHIESATLILDRVQLTPDDTSRALGLLKAGNLHMVYTQLETKVNIINKNTLYYNWLDCLNGASSPNRMYFAFISQSAYYGDITKCSTYFEHANLSSLQMKLDGRPLLIKPITTSFVTETDSNADDFGDLNVQSSEAIEGYMSLCQIFDQISNPLAPHRIGYKEYLSGGTIYGLELSKCGEKQGSTGTYDLHLTFGHNGCSERMAILMFTERSSTICLQG